MQRLFLFLGVVATASVTWSSSAHADPASKRHLVYDFTVGVHSSSAMTDTKTGGGDYKVNSNVSDKGQITVDYLGVEADGGLVVNVAENGRDRKLAATPCVVYANTNVQCGAVDVNPEEVSIVRTLSPKFFDPTSLDAKRHWNISVPAAGVNIDFTVTPQSAGALQIDSERVEKTSKGDSTTASAKYTYQPARYLPTELKEYATMNLQVRPGQYASVQVDVTATLTSDSLASGS